MASRSLTSALRAARRLNEPSRKCPALLARGFSGTAANGLRHTFTETENPDLNNVLQTIQEKIIFPAYLPTKQRKLIFDPTKRTYLAQNPVIIEVDGEEYRFSPLNRFTDLPNSKSILHQALINMRTRKDWANLPTLLSGYHSAQIKLRPEDWRKIARLAGDTGNIYEVIECAKQVGETGFELNDKEVVLRVFAHINAKITDSNWDAAETKQALKWSEIVLDLLHRPEHKAKKLHLSRPIRGMHLFTRTCAVKAKEHTGESTNADLTLLEDELKLVESLWQPILSRPHDDIRELSALEPGTDKASKNVTSGISGSVYVRILSQNIKGIAMARELVPGQFEGLSAVEDVLKRQLRAFLESPENAGKKWESVYEEVMSLSNPSGEQKAAEESPVEAA